MEPMHIKRVFAGMAMTFALVAGCTSSGSNKSSSDSGFGDPGSCTVVELTVSPEKIDLMNAFAKQFNGSPRAKVGSTCTFVRPQRVSSGAAATALSIGWDEQQ